MTSKSAMKTSDQESKRFETAWQFIEEVTTNCEDVQKKVLAEILSRNKETEYLKRHGMQGATDRDTFKSKVPVVKYEDIQLDIQRIANGDFSPILCDVPISEFLTSSGTSKGERKLIPTTLEEKDRRLRFVSLQTPIMNRYMPGLNKGKALYFLFIKAETKTPGGLVAHPTLTSYYKSPHFRNRPFDPYNVYTSPNEAILYSDTFQSMYAQILCGLYDRLEVTRMGAIFASGLLRAIRFLQLHYRDLCHDILTGSLSVRITDQALRGRMMEIIRPDPELARFIENMCCQEKWEGMITKIWPNAKYLDVVVTGTMAQYIPILDYYSGGLPKVCLVYASSECYFGVNLKPLCDPSEICYTLMPNMAYFEFIPLGEPTNSTTDSTLQLMDLANLEVGKEYELVVTTYAGLYRYRVGDVLYVTSFYNSAPQFKYVRRRNVLLSIDSDKTDELELHKAIQKGCALLLPFNTSVIEYTSYVDTKTIPGHYVIYLELLIKDSGKGPSPKVLDQCCLEIEETLNSVYRQCRVADQTIGPLEIRVVKKGTFEKLMDYSITRGASITQYKVPRCVDDTRIVELLDSGVVSAHFSPSMPHWSPDRRVDSF